MKKVLLSVLAIGSLTSYAGAAAQAAQNDDVLARIEALEKKVAALSEEKNAALRENQVLRQQNATLKPTTKPQATAVPTAGRSGPLRAYASAPPMAYKGPVADARGRLRVWGEGGAIWSGGDSISSNYSLNDFTKGTPLFVGLFPGGTIPGSFDLTPKVGWEAATGFDYRFNDSLWHVSGQFRYGEGRNTGLASTAGAIDPVLLGLLGGGFGGVNFTALGGSEALSTTYKETHWLADLAVGRDVLGSGPGALQVKGGLRIAEFIGTTGTTDTWNSVVSFAPPVAILGPGGPLISSFGRTMTTVTNQRSSFLGAGPRLGIEGSVPFAGNWALDYIGDAAVLFGNQRLVNTQSSSSVVTPAVVAILAPAGTLNTMTDQRFATVFNADIQVGVSYWMSQNVKVSASYRLDAFFGVLNQTFAVGPQTTDRYIHGPRLGVSAVF